VKKLASLLNGLDSRRLPSIRATRVARDGDKVHLYYHSTPVITEYPDGSVTVRTGGWRTSTTKSRINDFLPYGWRVFQHQHEWFWSRITEAGRTVVPFNDGDLIATDGSLNPVLPNLNAA
jgi:hypothetical protein